MRRWEDDTLECIRCVIAAVTNEPLSEVLHSLVQADITLQKHICPPPPTIKQLLVLKDQLLIPNNKWGEVVDTFNLDHGKLPSIQQYDHTHTPHTAHAHSHCMQTTHNT